MICLDMGRELEKMAHKHSRSSCPPLQSITGAEREQNVGTQISEGTLLTGLPFTSQVMWAMGRDGLVVQFASKVSPT
jgi:hypothetical protein